MVGRWIVLEQRGSCPITRPPQSWNLHSSSLSLVYLVRLSATSSPEVQHQFTSTMADQIYLCTPPLPPFNCTFFAATPNIILTHLLSSPLHPTVAAYRRLHGTASLALLPITATLHPRHPPPLTSTTIYICTACSTYFSSHTGIHQHLLSSPAHAAASTAAIDHDGEAGFHEHVRRDHGRALVLASPGVPPVPRPFGFHPPPPALAAAPLRHLLITFSPPYNAAATTIVVPAATMTTAALSALIDDAYGAQRQPRIAWAPLWAAGLVLRIADVAGATAGRVLRCDRDVEEVVGVMEVGECWVGERVRHP